MKPDVQTCPECKHDRDAHTVWVDDGIHSGDFLCRVGGCKCGGIFGAEEDARWGVRR